MEQSILDQDILLDTIKEYRKIIQGLILTLNNTDNIFCRELLNKYNNYIDINPFNYDYSYKGVEEIKNDMDEHIQTINTIMNDLKESNDNQCNEIYHVCFNSPIFKEYMPNITID